MEARYRLATCHRGERNSWSGCRPFPGNWHELILTDLLNGSHYEVIAAADGRSGLRQALARPFDLMILDVMLPDMDGLQLCRTFREHGFDGGILMLTAL